MNTTTRAGKKPLGPILHVALICLATYLLLLVILYVCVTPEQVDIQIGAPAPTQIKATKDILDVVTTESSRERAAAEVEPSYKSVDPTVVSRVSSRLDSVFAKLRGYRGSYTVEEAAALSDEDLQKLCDDLGFDLTREQLTALVNTDPQESDAVFSDAVTEVRKTLDATLPQGQEDSALRNINGNLIQAHSSSLALVDIAMAAVGQYLEPNMLIDEEITEANRQAARDEVQPVWYVKDQEIVAEGKIVTEAQYAMIAGLGILDANGFDSRLVIGLALLDLIVLLAIGVYLKRFDPGILKDSKTMSLLGLILVISMSFCLGFRYIHSYLMPMSMVLLLTALLIDMRLALFTNFMMSLLASVLAPASSGVFAYVLMTVSGPVIALLFARSMQRTTTLLSGVIIGAINFLVTLAAGFVNSAEMHDVLFNSGVAAASGLISAIICIGLQPLLELLFNLATPSRLIELSNPNQPLLRRLLLEASGTYHHSIIVANLAEAACTAIGANGLLARVGAYYHDIGKLKRPMYFKENQMGDNPHDRTDPRVSTAILTAHTRDGAQMAQKARIPTPIIDIIREHHGDTPVLFFYDKALKLYGDQVDISAFRYEGPRPRTREAAVVMLADTIEAATRAMENPNPEKIDALIRKLVRGKLNDGQLDNSPLTFADLDKVCAAFSTVLTGVFHERIEYPDIAIPPRSDAPASAETEEPPAERSADAAAAPAVKAESARVPAAPAAAPAPEGSAVSIRERAPAAAAESQAPSSAASDKPGGIQAAAVPLTGTPVPPVAPEPVPAVTAAGGRSVDADGH